MQIIPNAIGQSSQTLVFWDDDPELGVALPRATQLVSELSWGFGTIQETPCLVLYLFIADQTLEMVLPRMLPTSLDANVDVWRLLIDWHADVLKLRYGNSPVDREREITLLLPTTESENLIDRLRLFTEKYEGELVNGVQGAQRELLQTLKSLLANDAEPGVDSI